MQVEVRGKDNFYAKFNECSLNVMSLKYHRVITKHWPCTSYYFTLDVVLIVRVALHIYLIQHFRHQKNSLLYRQVHYTNGILNFHTHENGGRSGVVYLVICQTNREVFFIHICI